MARTPGRPKPPKQVEALRHEEASRKNIPTAEYQAILAKESESPVEVRYPRGVSGRPEDRGARNQQDANWTNRIILGDSVPGLSSLLDSTLSKDL